MSIDLDGLWDVDDPEGTEARLRALLPVAEGDVALILQTQIARTWGLRRDFGRATALLDSLRPAVSTAGPEARARFWLEVGRSLVSTAHKSDERTAHGVAEARDAYGRALETARAAGIDALAIDAIHMMAIVDTDPTEQLAWNERGLAIARASDQPAAHRWEASLRNNRGLTLHELGRDEEALTEFRRALALREAAGDPRLTRVAWWMVAWVLRHLERPAEAQDIQLRLERECDEAGEPDPYVFEELELLYRSQGNEERATHYAARRATT
jgi:tetratricopeptide (TPR) repeat protein